MINWTVIKLTVPPTFDARPLSYITGDRLALSIARFRRAGQLATADTGFYECDVGSLDLSLTPKS